jgi:hypothetical protein
VDVSNSVELALTDVTDPNTDDTAVVPQRLLARGGTIRHDALPVDVEVHEFMKNSDLVDPRRANGENVRVSVMGETWAVVPQPEGAGVDANQREDAPSARVTLKRKDTGAPVGTYVVSLWYYPNFVVRQRQLAFPPQTFVLDGRTYTVELRPERVYKPYQLTLLDFKHELYLGTNTPKNFESVVRVTDAAGGDAREARIYMNNPLRMAPDGSTVGLIFSGETLYQSSFLPGDTGTVLQVVQNPGWLLPYVSCVLVFFGMVTHFGMNLINFLSAQVRAKA